MTKHNYILSQPANTTNMIKNPLTNRMIKVDGFTYKKLLKKGIIPLSPPPSLPEVTIDLPMDCMYTIAQIEFTRDLDCVDWKAIMRTCLVWPAYKDAVFSILLTQWYHIMKCTVNKKGVIRMDLMGIRFAWAWPELRGRIMNYINGKSEFMWGKAMYYMTSARPPVFRVIADKRNFSASWYTSAEIMDINWYSTKQKNKNASIALIQQIAEGARFFGEITGNQLFGKWMTLVASLPWYPESKGFLSCRRWTPIDNARDIKDGMLITNLGLDNYKYFRVTCGEEDIVVYIKKYY